MRVLNYDTFRVTDEMLASKGLRFANYIVDRIGSTAFAFVFFYMFALIASALGFDSIVYALQNINGVLDWVLTTLLVLIYYFVLEHLFSKSIGKFITRTTVVNEKGEKPDPFDVFIRSISRIVPFEAFSFLGEDSYGWHDSWSETFVVKDTIFTEHKTAFEELNEFGKTDKVESEFEAFLKE